MGNKRKGDDADVSALSASLSRVAVVFSPRNPNAAATAHPPYQAAELACKSRLQSLLQSLSSSHDDDRDDPVLSGLNQAATARSQSLPQQQKLQLAHAAAAQKQLASQIDEVRARLHRERTHAAALQQQQAQLRRRAAALGGERRQLRAQSQRLASEMDQWREQLQAEEEDHEEHLQEQCHVTVPRLQYQISLYAAMTGIKWDYEAQEEYYADNNADGGNNMLVGLVVRTFW